MEREKHTKSGKLFEIDFYPVLSDGRRLAVRAAKTMRSTLEQEKYNYNQAKKKLIRYVNTNFNESDYLMHPTYDSALAPQDIKAARKDLTKYLNAVKTQREKELKKKIKRLKALPNTAGLEEMRKELMEDVKLLSKPFKYIYVIEKQIYKTGLRAGTANWHFHLFITGGLSGKTLESMWPHGIRTNADNFQPEKFGPDAAAKYMTKEPQGGKRFVCSKNIEKPTTPEPKDGHITERIVQKMAKERIDDAGYWERKYKGYRFLKAYPRYNDFNGHWYLSVVMYKLKGTVPKWNEEEWMTEGE